jgi:putative peptidoglycan lipid II flippase
MLPAVLGVSVAQISLLINTQIASYLPPGSVSWLSYSDRLMEFPTALLGVALGVVLMPQLAAAKAADDAQRYSAMIDWGLRLVLLFALPCAVALLVFSRPLVESLFHYGRFTANDAAQVTRSLMGYGLGLLGLVGIKVLAPAYFARGDMKTPVKIAVAVLVFTQILNYLLVPHLQHAALTLSISLGALLNASWLLLGLVRKGSYQPQPGWGKAIAQIVLASAVLGAGLWGVQQYLDWSSLHAMGRVAYLLATIAALGLAYFASLALLGFPVRQMMRR